MQDPHAEDERFATFYYNLKTGETMWKEPEWDLIWAERRKRSNYVESNGGWEKMLDPVINKYFWFSLKEGQYTWQDPFAEYYEDQGAYGYDY